MIDYWLATTDEVQKPFNNSRCIYIWVYVGEKHILKSRIWIGDGFEMYFLKAQKFFFIISRDSVSNIQTPSLSLDKPHEIWKHLLWWTTQENCNRKSFQVSLGLL